MDARNRDLAAWISRVRTGQLQLPRFQRFEAWGTREVADLLQTVVDQLPAGAVLIVEIGDKAPFHHRPLEGAATPTERMTELLLDGQQRLTAVFRALNDDYGDHTYFVDARQVDLDEDGRTDYRVSSQGRWLHKGRRYPIWCDDPKQVIGRGLVPFRLLLPDDETSWKAWLQEATAGNTDTYRELLEAVMELRERVRHFNLPYLALPVGSPEEVVLNVFVKTNTSSVALTAFDIIVARVEEETGKSLHDLVAALEGQVPDLTRYSSARDLVLPAAALLQGKRPTQREMVFLDFDRMIVDWPLLTRGATQLVAFLRDEGIPDGSRLPSSVVLAPLIALWAHAPESPDGLGAVRTLLRSYLWRAFTTSRYEFAAATASFQDFDALLPIVQQDAPGVAQAPIFDLPLPTTDEIVAAGWPKRRDRLARAILCVSFRRGALDIADGAPITAANVTSREYHHLYPVAFLRGQGIPESSASRALNCALVTWRTNRTVAAKPPIEYLRDRADTALLGESQVRERVESHEIDYDDLAAGDFQRFLERRAERMAQAFERLANGAAWP